LKRRKKTENKLSEMSAASLSELCCHPWLKTRPNFVRACTGFHAFLKVTKSDLLDKKEALEQVSIL
jgi:hypothetical protein